MNTILHPRKIAIVCNNKAGKGKALAIARRIGELLLEKSILFQSFTASWPSDFEGFTEVWLTGGDGTLNYFVNQYPNLELPLALFKGGSGNDFAWKLYGNLEFEEYIEKALAGKATPVDAGACNGKLFMNGVGIGFDGDIVRSMGAKRIHAGHLAYLFTVLKRIFFFREIDISVQSSGISLHEKLFLVSVANGSRYGGGFMVAPAAKIDDGLLNLVVIRAIHPVKRCFYLPQVEKGKHLHHDFVISSLEKNVIVRAAQMMPAHLDGELMIADHFEIRILPAHYLFIY